MISDCGVFKFLRRRVTVIWSGGCWFNPTGVEDSLFTPDDFLVGLHKMLKGIAIPGRCDRHHYLVYGKSFLHIG